MEPTDDGVMLRAISRQAEKPAKTPAQTLDRTPLSQLIGCIKYSGRPISVKEMDYAIRNEVKARHARGRY